MVWVRSEYASELAVVFAWLSLLLPWNVTVANYDGLGRMLFVRFSVIHVQYLYGFPLINGEPFEQAGIAVTDTIYLADPTAARSFYAGLGSSELVTANLLWGIGALVLLLSVALAATMYADEDRVRELLVDPVRVVGALLGIAALVLTGATVQFWTAFPGPSLPVGVILLYAFAGILLTADRA